MRKNTQRLTRTFAKAAMTASPVLLMAAPAHAMEYEAIFETCFTLKSEADTPSPRVNEVLRELNRIEQYKTFISSKLIRDEKADKTKICMKKLDYAGAGATYSSNTKQVALGYNPYDTTTNRLSYLFHEFVHAAQDEKDLLDLNRGWSPYELQQRTLAVESAAKTAEYMTAYDLKAYGYANIWNLITANRMRVGADKIDMAYKAEFAKSQNHGEALAAAAAEFWEFNNNEQKWLNFYNERVIRGYLYLYQENKIKRDNGLRPPSVNDIKTSYEMADGTGLFSRITSLPSGTGNNVKHDDILKHMQVEHFAKKYGRNSAPYKQAYVQYNEAANPFLNVNLDDIPLDAKNITVQFDCLAGLYNCELKDGEYKWSSKNNYAVNVNITSPINRYKPAHSIPR